MKKLGTILLIDDDRICSYLNQQLLEEMQIFDSVVCLNDGQEVLDYLQKAFASRTEIGISRPALIFLDLNMPGLDGFQVLEELYKMDRESVKRIVILSSSMHPLDQERAGRYEIFDYLVKPLTQTKVLGVIDRFLQSQLHSANKQDLANSPAAKDRPPMEKPAGSAKKNPKKKDI